VLEDRTLPSFGTTGIVLTDVNPNGRDYAYRAAHQSDGRIVAAGPGGLARYQSNGSLDATFNAGGSLPGTLALPSGTIYDVALQGDGKIVTAGEIPGTTDTADFLLRRFNPDGSSDAAFGVNGVVTTAFKHGSYSNAIYAIAIQSDSKIVAVGVINFGWSSGSWAVARYNPNGSLDTTFGRSGWVTTSFSAGSTRDEANAVAIQTNGQIVAAGQAQVGDFGVARYNPNGSLDTSFGSAGKVLVDFGGIDKAYDLALQGDGKIVVGGGSLASPTIDNLALARLNPSGSLDTGFGNGGRVAVNSPIGDSTIHAWNGISLQSDGKIVTVGGDASCVYVSRYNLNGSLDTTFARNGWQAFWFNPASQDPNTGNGYSDRGSDVVVQPADGKILVVGGYNYTLSGEEFALARLNPDGSFDGTPVLTGAPQIGSLTASAATVTAGSSVTLTASGVTDVNAGGIVLEMAFYAQINGVNTLLGYGTFTAVGTWSFTFTVNLAPGTYTLFAQAEDNYGTLSNPDLLTLQVQ
jgi:uncharacterized delta-60 repeat protein